MLELIKRLLVTFLEPLTRMAASVAAEAQWLRRKTFTDKLWFSLCCNPWIAEGCL